MLFANDKPLCIIGFEQSTVTQEAMFFLSQEFSGEIIILEPDVFLTYNNKTQYQYFVAFTLDIEKRIKVIEVIESMQLDCIKYAHDTTICYNKNIDQVLGRGSFIAPYTTLLMGSQIGPHCILETHCLVAHYSRLAQNVILHVGTLIAGKTNVGPNCVFNFKSSTINHLIIDGNIEVGATSTLTKNINQSGYYVGSPARRAGDRKSFEK